MSALKDFQSRYGGDWLKIVNSEPFLAALSMANCEKLEAIRALTPKQIQEHGPIILSDFVGHMNYENALLGLAEKKEFVFGQLPPEEYPDPIAEAREENLVERQEESSIVSHAGPSIHGQLFPTPLKKRGRPPGRKKKK